MMKTAGRSPTPNQRIAIGIQASGEMGRKIWRNGPIARSPRRDPPRQRPSGMATSAAIA
jgi:hypothetical protein